MSNVLFVVLVVVAMALAEAAYSLVKWLGERKGEELKRRLRAVGEPTAGITILRKRHLANSAWLDELLSLLPTAARLETLIEQSGLEWSVARLLVMSAVFCVVGFVGGTIALTVIAGLALAALGAFLPTLYVMRARAARSRRISEQLPEALDMMARAIRAGHALPSSFKLVAQECPPPVAVEFAKAYEQQNLGISFDQSVLNITTRVPSNLDLKLFAVSVVIQKETGGNLVEVLENITNMLRERFKFYSKLRALTAEGRLSGIILGSLPFAVAVMVALTNPGYLGELRHGMGRSILVGGLVMWTLGIVWIKKLMRVDF